MCKNKSSNNIKALVLPNENVKWDFLSKSKRIINANDLPPQDQFNFKPSTLMR